jgi:hypothetical protein
MNQKYLTRIEPFASTVFWDEFLGRVDWFLLSSSPDYLYKIVKPNALSLIISAHT